MFVDTHLHLSQKEGVAPSEFIRRAKDAGVSRFVVSCCDKESIVEGMDLAKEFDGIYLAVGFHPEVVAEIGEEDLLWLESLLSKKDLPIVAIGEIGLDYHWVKDNKEQQRSLFEKQLELATRYHLPVVIHTRDAIQETYDILNQYSLKGVIHCYSGSVEMAQRFIELGYYLGIGGVVTFSNSKLYQVVESVGLSFLLLETDSPYLAPVPYRGKTNESCYIPIIAARLASILQVSIEEVATVTTHNAETLFDFSHHL